MSSTAARLSVAQRSRAAGLRGRKGHVARLLDWWDGVPGGAAPTPASLSDAIGFARLALMTGLVFLHYGAYPGLASSPFDGFDPHAHPVATFANSFVLFFFFSVVPLLATISGWLFFGFGVADARNALTSRIRHHLRSLYLPLLAWNGVYLLAAVVAFRLWPDAAFFDALNIDVVSAKARDYVDAITALTGHPIAFQFWFVRDLLLVVLLSPLWWAGLRWAPLLGASLLGTVWITGHDLWIFFRTDVLFFFYAGGLLRWRRMAVDLSARTTMILLALYVGLLFARTVAPAAVDLSVGRPEWLEVATRAMRLIGIAACWGLCLQAARTASGRFVARYAGVAFFLFATHFPVIALVKAVLWPLTPQVTDGWLIVHYVGSVIATLAICLVAGLVLARVAPRWFALMNGGRLLPIASAPGPAAVRRQVHDGRREITR
jgi:succinoglycan biosynthesis protein ExoH